MTKPSNEIAVSKAAAAFPANDAIREVVFPGSTRRISINRKCVAFVVEAKQVGQTIIGFRTWASACPVDAPYEDVYAWWRRKPMPQQQDERTSTAPTRGEVDQNGHSPTRTKNANALPLPSSNRSDAIAKKPIVQVKRRFPGTLTLAGKARTVFQAEKIEQ
jgi:hypothetical protein